MNFQPAMTIAQSGGLHAWLMSEHPASRRQAALGRAYGAWRTFARNRLAMLGLLIVVMLVGVALLADVLAPFSPFQGRLAHHPAAAAIGGALVWY
jgi:peptide/nickel transport system permease protein